MNKNISLLNRQTLVLKQNKIRAYENTRARKKSWTFWHYRFLQTSKTRLCLAFRVRRRCASRSQRASQYCAGERWHFAAAPPIATLQTQVFHENASRKCCGYAQKLRRPRTIISVLKLAKLTQYTGMSRVENGS